MCTLFTAALVASRTRAVAFAMAVAVAAAVSIAIAPTAAAVETSNAGVAAAQADVTGALPPARLPLGRPTPRSAAVPALRRSVTVTSDIVRLGDLIDNAGDFASIPVFRSPDVGTTGAVPGRKVIEAARANNLFGVEAGDVLEIEVTRAGHVVSRKEIEARIAQLFAGTNGLGDISDLVVSFDREPAKFNADLDSAAELKAMRAALEPRSGRFDVVFEVPIGASRRTLMRYTGTIIETADAIVPVHAIGRGEIIRVTDLATERRPKAEVGNDAIASTAEAIGRAARQALRAGQPVHHADIVKPELVRRDDNVTLVYEAPGIMLTSRGKALEGGGEGDIINVLNLQSRRNVQGVVIAPGRVDIAAAVAPRPIDPLTSDPLASAAEPAATE